MVVVVVMVVGAMVVVVVHGSSFGRGHVSDNGSGGKWVVVVGVVIV